jgi:hypothetical protein
MDKLLGVLAALGGLAVELAIIFWLPDAPLLRLVARFIT